MKSLTISFVLLLVVGCQVHTGNEVYPYDPDEIYVPTLEDISVVAENSRFEGACMSARVNGYNGSQKLVITFSDFQVFGERLYGVVEHSTINYYYPNCYGNSYEKVISQDYVSFSPKQGGYVNIDILDSYKIINGYRIYAKVGGDVPMWIESDNAIQFGFYQNLTSGNAVKASTIYHKQAGVFDVSDIPELRVDGMYTSCNGNEDAVSMYFDAIVGRLNVYKHKYPCWALESGVVDYFTFMNDVKEVKDGYMEVVEERNQEILTIKVNYFWKLSENSASIGDINETFYLKISQSKYGDTFTATEEYPTLEKLKNIGFSQVFNKAE